MIATISIIIGCLLVIASIAGLVLLLHHHGHPHDHKTAKKSDVPGAPTLPAVSLPTAAELEAQLKLAYENQITNASRQFGEDLRVTSQKLSEQVTRLTGSVIEEELSGYQQTLEQVRKVATETMEQIHQAVEGQRVELRQNMEAELAEERKRLIAQFDTRLGDIVASYVAESLGGGVDLGSQLKYITETLEANKDALKQDLMNGN